MTEIAEKRARGRARRVRIVWREARRCPRRGRRLFVSHTEQDGTGTRYLACDRRRGGCGFTDKFVLQGVRKPD